MNFARDVVDRNPPGQTALIELCRDGRRREWTFSEIAERSSRLAGAIAAQGVGTGDVVMTLIGNRSEWVLAMVACFRLGAIALPCTEQLRAKDLQHRLTVAQPSLIICDARNRVELDRARPQCVVLTVPDDALYAAEPVPVADLSPTDPCLITFTSGTSGDPKAVVHGQRYLSGQELQASNWLEARPGDIVWCTASSGWSKSARNAFVAPWLRGATAMLHDDRFDPSQRLELVEQEKVSILCMAPTEYRLITKHARLRPMSSLRATVSAGEALDAEAFGAWNEATGLQIRDGYGQTETGQLTGAFAGTTARPGSMGRALPGIKLWVHGGELVVDPATVPTFFLRYLGAAVPDGLWQTGDRVTQDEDGYLYFAGRSDDIIISAGYRIGPSEVEAALLSHPTVVEAAVVGAPDEMRGSVVRAVIVLRDEKAASDRLTRELQDHVKRQTAPYKYPRIVEFVRELPKTPTGKIQRARLRSEFPA